MRRRSVLFLYLLIFLAIVIEFKANASPTGAILKQLSSLVKWPGSSPKAKISQNDGNLVQFENGYFVETLVEGDKLGVVPQTIRISPEGELLAVDSLNHKIVQFTPPLSEYSRGRLVAGSFQGYSGHIDGKPNEARFKQPRGVTMDDKGNVYVADTANLAIRKIGEGGVTTIAGGKSNVGGYRDGPSEDAKFSTDFDLVYIKKTCSLLVIDRGNAALRQISLQQEDCDYHENSVLSSDIVLVIGAVLAGYIFCLLQHCLGSLISHKPKQDMEEQEEQEKSNKTEKTPLIVETLKDEPSAVWPSLGILLSDLFKISIEALGNMFLNSIPFGLGRGKGKTDLSPLKDRLVMAEDREETTPIAQKLKTNPTVSDSVQTPINNKLVNEATPKATKSNKVPKLKDPLSSKHRSSTKRQDFADYYGSAEPGQLGGSKGQKERARYRHREKSGEVGLGLGLGFGQTESKPGEMKPVDFGDTKFDHYNIRSKYGADGGFRY